MYCLPKQSGKRGRRRDGKKAERRDEEEENGDLQSGLGVLSITNPALGGERKMLDM